MDIRKLQRAIVDGLEDVKAQDIVVFNTEHLSPLFERVIIASGTSNRQAKALAASVRDAVRAAGFQVIRTEGESNGEWIIVDCAAAVVHVMQPVIRQYYQLEEIWGEKPVAITLKGAKKGLVKASEPEEDAPAKKTKARAGTAKDAAPTAPPKRVAAKKATAKEEALTPPKRAAAKKAAAPAAKKTLVKKVAATKVASKKAPAQKAAPTPVTGKAPARKVVAKKAVATKTVTKIVVNEPKRKPAAKKVVAVKRIAAKKVAVKKVAAKKAPAKKTAR